MIAYKRRNDDVRELYRNLSRCARLVKLCDRIIHDHGGKRHTKTGKNQATTHEIRAVIKIASGEDRREINRNDYITTVTPQHNIIVMEKTGRNRNQYSATAQQLDNYFARMYGQKYANVGASDEFQNVNPGQSYSSAANTPNEYTQQVINQDNSKITKTIGELVKIVSMIAVITSTLGSIKVGPAVDNIKEAAGAVGQFKNFAAKSIKKLNKAIQKRMAKRAAAKAAKAGK